MFLAALIYLIILVVAALGWAWPEGPNRASVVRISGLAQWVLFVIIGIALFWSVLNK